MRSLEVWRTQKIVIALIVVDEAGKESADCELQFNRVRDSMIDARGARGFGRIISYDAANDSPYLRTVKARAGSRFRPNEELIHFSVCSEHATLNIIAPDFTFAVTDKGIIIGPDEYEDFGIIVDDRDQ